MRLLLPLRFLLCAVGRGAVRRANPVTQPSKLDPAWQAQDPRDVRDDRSKSRRSRARDKVPHGRLLVADQLKAAGFPPTTSRSCPTRRHGRQDGRADRALAGRGTAGQEADPADGAHGRGRGQARRLEARPVRVHREGRLFLRPRDDDNKAGLIGTRRRPDQAASRPGSSRPRPHPLLHRRRGNRAAMARAGRDRMAPADSTPNMRSTPMAAAAPSSRDGRPLGFGAADRRKDLPDLHLHRAQQGRAQQPPAPRQCHLRARRRRSRSFRRIASSRC